MNKIFIDRIAPGHDRSDCSDDNLKNHTRTPFDQGCRRCDLLKAAEEVLEDLNLKFRPQKQEYPKPPAPPKSRVVCNMCGDITETGKHTGWLCKVFKWLK